MIYIKIILVDDHQLLLEGIASLLKSFDYIDIVGKAASGEEAINVVDEKKPHVVLMDIMMGGMTGIEAARWIKEQNPETKIILISSDVNDEFVSLAIQSGVDGYLPKNVDKATLIESIRKVMEGERYFAKEVTDIVIDQLYNKPQVKPKTESKELTNRENEVLYHLALGKNNGEIADDLCISIKTVETHKSNIMDKLDFNNMVDLTKYAIKNNIVNLD